MLDNIIADIKSSISREEYQNENNIKQISKLLNSFQIEDLMEFHYYLEKEELVKIYNIIDKVQLPKSALEHFLYNYYSKVDMDSYIYDQLLSDYAKYRYLGLESTIVSLIKYDVITQEQIAKIEKESISSEMEKQLFQYQIRRKIQHGIVEVEEIRKLIELNAFDLLIQILNSNKLSVESLHLFEEAAENTVNKNKKNKLYSLAREKLNS